MQSKKVMEHKGFIAQIMEAERLVGDQTFGLPPGTPLEVYHSDQFEKWPENYMKNSFLVPVKPNKGLWFDFTNNDSNNTAIVPTLKGCNPITGQQTSGFHLERYETRCPKHGCAFLAERFCPECDYKWKPQNYIAFPNILWWDTWTNGDIGRQFFFTEDELRDVATHMIGKENTVPAFGFAFFRPKEPRPEGPKGKITMYGESYAKYTQYALYEVKNTLSQSVYYSSSTAGSPIGMDFSENYLAESGSTGEVKTRCCADSHSKSISLAGGRRDELKMSIGHLNSVRIKETPVKDVSIGAGAKIRQSLLPDPYALDSWKDAPDSVMTIYFVFQEKFEELKAGGMIDVDGHPEGMLAGLPVG